MRNFEFKSTIKLAIAVATCLLLLENRESYSQTRRPSRFPFPRQAELTKPTPEPKTVDGAPATSAVVNVTGNVKFDELLDRAIEVTSKRYLTGSSTVNRPHSPWQIFHCILALRQESLVRVGNEKVNAIKWLSTTEPSYANEPWLMLTPHGAKFHPYTQKYFFEGHPGQFMALLSHSNLPMDHQFHVQGKVVTMADMVNNLKKEVNAEEEVTWVLWALQHYLDPDAEWLNKNNERWSIERLVQIETASPIVGPRAPCGGNHRLFALTRARDKYLKHGGELRGDWLLAHQKIMNAIQIARKLQNSDGSFSSKSYEGADHTTDVNQRFNTTGHTMEFLSIALPDEQLNEPWVRNAVWMLSRELIIHQKTEIDCGPLFHTLDALILYRDRVRKKSNAAEPEKASEVATSEPKTPAQTSKASPDSASKVPGVNSNSERSNKQGTAELPIRVPVPGTIGLPNLNKDAPTASTGNGLELQTPIGDLNKANPTSPFSKVPKIDPGQLGGIGKPAPATKPGSGKSDADCGAAPEPIPASVPALLPDESATPLTSIDPLAPQLDGPASALNPVNL